MQGLFKGLFWRVALISTTFFLVNTFKQQTVPLLFPHAVQDEPVKTSLEVEGLNFCPGGQFWRKSPSRKPRFEVIVGGVERRVCCQPPSSSA